MRRRKLGETGRKKMIQLIYILITELPIYPKKWMVRSFFTLYHWVVVLCTVKRAQLRGPGPSIRKPTGRRRVSERDVLTTVDQSG